MTYKYRGHVDRVKAWINPATKDLSSEQLVALFEQTMTALWTRARSTMSSVMMTAVLERVILDSSENHPILSLLKITDTGVDFDEFHKSGNTLSANQVLEAFQMTIVEFIAILGGLTNEVISPALYSELSKVKLEVKLKAVPRANGEKYE